ncbi:unnamed protein product [Amoebophrya sp. A25]|nr:unnamed protein product [Amoebophrya sp. A25]|eukprot:GSA25T00003044001.1
MNAEAVALRQRYIAKRQFVPSRGRQAKKFYHGASNAAGGAGGPGGNIVDQHLHSSANNKARGELSVVSLEMQDPTTGKTSSNNNNKIKNSTSVFVLDQKDMGANTTSRSWSSMELVQQESSNGSKPCLGGPFVHSQAFVEAARQQQIAAGKEQQQHQLLQKRGAGVATTRRVLASSSRNPDQDEDFNMAATSNSSVWLGPRQLHNDSTDSVNNISRELVGEMHEEQLLPVSGRAGGDVEAPESPKGAPSSSNRAVPPHGHPSRRGGRPGVVSPIGGVEVSLSLSPRHIAAGGSLPGRGAMGGSPLMSPQHHRGTQIRTHHHHLQQELLTPRLHLEVRGSTAGSMTARSRSSSLGTRSLPEEEQLRSSRGRRGGRSRGTTKGHNHNKRPRTLTTSQHLLVQDALLAEQEMRMIQRGEQQDKDYEGVSRGRNRNIVRAGGEQQQVDPRRSTEQGGQARAGRRGRTNKEDAKKTTTSINEDKNGTKWNASLLQGFQNLSQEIRRQNNDEQLGTAILEGLEEKVGALLQKCLKNGGGALTRDEANKLRRAFMTTLLRIPRRSSLLQQGHGVGGGDYNLSGGSLQLQLQGGLQSFPDSPAGRGGQHQHMMAGPGSMFDQQHPGTMPLALTGTGFHSTKASTHLEGGASTTSVEDPHNNTRGRLRLNKSVEQGIMGLLTQNELKDVFDDPPPVAGAQELQGRTASEGVAVIRGHQHHQQAAGAGGGPAPVVITEDHHAGKHAARHVGSTRTNRAALNSRQAGASTRNRHNLSVKELPSDIVEKTRTRQEEANLSPRGRAVLAGGRARRGRAQMNRAAAARAAAGRHTRSVDNLPAAPPDFVLAKLDEGPQYSEDVEEMIDMTVSHFMGDAGTLDLDEQEQHGIPPVVPLPTSTPAGQGLEVAHQSHKFGGGMNNTSPAYFFDRNTVTGATAAIITPHLQKNGLEAGPREFQQHMLGPQQTGISPPPSRGHLQGRKGEMVAGSPSYGMRRTWSLSGAASSIGPPPLSTTMPRAHTPNNTGHAIWRRLMFEAKAKYHQQMRRHATRRLLNNEVHAGGAAGEVDLQQQQHPHMTSSIFSASSIDENGGESGYSTPEVTDFVSPGQKSQQEMVHPHSIRFENPLIESFFYKKLVHEFKRGEPSLVLEKNLPLQEEEEFLEQPVLVEPEQGGREARRTTTSHLQQGRGGTQVVDHVARSAAGEVVGDRAGAAAGGRDASVGGPRRRSLIQQDNDGDAQDIDGASSSEGPLLASAQPTTIAALPPPNKDEIFLVYMQCLNAHPDLSIQTVKEQIEREYWESHFGAFFGEPQHHQELYLGRQGPPPAAGGGMASFNQELIAQQQCLQQLPRPATTASFSVDHQVGVVGLDGVEQQGGVGGVAPPGGADATQQERDERGLSPPDTAISQSLLKEHGWRPLLQDADVVKFDAMGARNNPFLTHSRPTTTGSFCSRVESPLYTTLQDYFAGGAAASGGVNPANGASPLKLVHNKVGPSCSLKGVRQLQHQGGPLVRNFPVSKKMADLLHMKQAFGSGGTHGVGGVGVVPNPLRNTTLYGDTSGGASGGFLPANQKFVPKPGLPPGKKLLASAATVSRPQSANLREDSDLQGPQFVIDGNQNIHNHERDTAGGAGGGVPQGGVDVKKYLIGAGGDSSVSGVHPGGSLEKENSLVMSLVAPSAYHNSSTADQPRGPVMRGVRRRYANKPQSSTTAAAIDFASVKAAELCRKLNSPRAAAAPAGSGQVMNVMNGPRGSQERLNQTTVQQQQQGSNANARDEMKANEKRNDEDTKQEEAVADTEKEPAELPDVLSCSSSSSTIGGGAGTSYEDFNNNTSCTSTSSTAQTSLNIKNKKGAPPPSLAGEVTDDTATFTTDAEEQMHGDGVDLDTTLISLVGGGTTDDDLLVASGEISVDAAVQLGGPAEVEVTSSTMLEEGSALLGEQGEASNKADAEGSAEQGEDYSNKDDADVHGVTEEEKKQTITTENQNGDVVEDAVKDNKDEQGLELEEQQANKDVEEDARRNIIDDEQQNTTMKKTSSKVQTSSKVPSRSASKSSTREEANSKTTTKEEKPKRSTPKKSSSSTTNNKTTTAGTTSKAPTSTKTSSSSKTSNKNNNDFSYLQDSSTALSSSDQENNSSDLLSKMKREAKKNLQDLKDPRQCAEFKMKFPAWGHTSQWRRRQIQPAGSRVGTAGTVGSSQDNSTSVAHSKNSSSTSSRNYPAAAPAASSRVLGNNAGTSGSSASTTAGAASSATCSDANNAEHHNSSSSTTAAFATNDVFHRDQSFSSSSSSLQMAPGGNNNYLSGGESTSSLQFQDSTCFDHDLDGTLGGNASLLSPGRSRSPLGGSQQLLDHGPGSSSRLSSVFRGNSPRPPGPATSTFLSGGLSEDNRPLSPLMESIVTMLLASSEKHLSAANGLNALSAPMTSSRMTRRLQRELSRRRGLLGNDGYRWDSAGPRLSTADTNLSGGDGTTGTSIELAGTSRSGGTSRPQSRAKGDDLNSGAASGTGGAGRSSRTTRTMNNMSGSSPRTDVGSGSRATSAAPLQRSAATRGRQLRGSSRPGSTSTSKVHVENSSHIAPDVEEEVDSFHMAGPAVPEQQNLLSFLQSHRDLISAAMVEHQGKMMKSKNGNVGTARTAGNTSCTTSPGGTTSTNRAQAGGNALMSAEQRLEHEKRLSGLTILRPTSVPGSPRYQQPLLKRSRHDRSQQNSTFLESGTSKELSSSSAALEGSKDQDDFLAGGSSTLSSGSTTTNVGSKDNKAKPIPRFGSNWKPVKKPNSTTKLTSSTSRGATAIPPVVEAVEGENVVKQLEEVTDSGANTRPVTAEVDGGEGEDKEDEKAEEDKENKASSSTDEILREADSYFRAQDEASAKLKTKKRRLEHQDLLPLQQHDEDDPVDLMKQKELLEQAPWSSLVNAQEHAEDEELEAFVRQLQVPTSSSSHAKNYTNSSSTTANYKSREQGQDQDEDTTSKQYQVVLYRIRAEKARQMGIPFHSQDEWDRIRAAEERDVDFIHKASGEIDGMALQDHLLRKIDALSNSRSLGGLAPLPHRRGDEHLHQGSLEIGIIGPQTSFLPESDRVQMLERIQREHASTTQASMERAGGLEDEGGSSTSADGEVLAPSGADRSREQVVVVGDRDSSSSSFPSPSSRSNVLSRQNIKSAGNGPTSILDHGAEWVPGFVTGLNNSTRKPENQTSRHDKNDPRSLLASAPASHDHHQRDLRTTWSGSLGHASVIGDTSQTLTGAVNDGHFLVMDHGHGNRAVPGAKPTAFQRQGKLQGTGGKTKLLYKNRDNYTRMSNTISFVEDNGENHEDEQGKMAKNNTTAPGTFIQHNSDRDKRSTSNRFGTNAGFRSITVGASDRSFRIDAADVRKYLIDRSGDGVENNEDGEDRATGGAPDQGREGQEYAEGGEDVNKMNTTFLRTSGAAQSQTSSSSAGGMWQTMTTLDGGASQLSNTSTSSKKMLSMSFEDKIISNRTGWKSTFSMASLQRQRELLGARGSTPASRGGQHSRSLELPRGASSKSSPQRWSRRSRRNFLLNCQKKALDVEIQKAADMKPPTPSNKNKEPKKSAGSEPFPLEQDQPPLHQDPSQSLSIQEDSTVTFDESRFSASLDDVGGVSRSRILVGTEDADEQEEDSENEGVPRRAEVDVHQHSTSTHQQQQGENENQLPPLVGSSSSSRTTRGGNVNSLSSLLAKKNAASNDSRSSSAATGLGSGTALHSKEYSGQRASDLEASSASSSSRTASASASGVSSSEEAANGEPGFVTATNWTKKVGTKKILKKAAATSSSNKEKVDKQANTRTTKDGGSSTSSASAASSSSGVGGDKKIGEQQASAGTNPSTSGTGTGTLRKGKASKGLLLLGSTSSAPANHGDSSFEDLCVDGRLGTASSSTFSSGAEKRSSASTSSKKGSANNSSAAIVGKLSTLEGTNTSATEQAAVVVPPVAEEEQQDDPSTPLEQQEQAGGGTLSSSVRTTSLYSGRGSINTAPGTASTATVPAGSRSGTAATAFISLEPEVNNLITSTEDLHKLQRDQSPLDSPRTRSASPLTYTYARVGSTLSTNSPFKKLFASAGYKKYTSLDQGSDEQHGDALVVGEQARARPRGLQKNYINAAHHQGSTMLSPSGNINNNKSMNQNVLKDLLSPAGAQKRTSRRPGGATGTAASALLPRVFSQVGTMILSTSSATTAAASEQEAHQQSSKTYSSPIKGRAAAHQHLHQSSEKNDPSTPAIYATPASTGKNQADNLFSHLDKEKNLAKFNKKNDVLLQGQLITTPSILLDQSAASPSMDALGNSGASISLLSAATPTPSSTRKLNTCSGWFSSQKTANSTTKGGGHRSSASGGNANVGMNGMMNNYNYNSTTSSLSVLHDHHQRPPPLDDFEAYQVSLRPNFAGWSPGKSKVLQSEVDGGSTASKWKVLRESMRPASTASISVLDDGDEDGCEKEEDRKYKKHNKSASHISSHGRRRNGSRVGSPFPSSRSSATKINTVPSREKDPRRQRHRMPGGRGGSGAVGESPKSSLSPRSGSRQSSIRGAGIPSASPTGGELDAALMQGLDARFKGAGRSRPANTNEQEEANLEKLFLSKLTKLQGALIGGSSPKMNKSKK